MQDSKDAQGISSRIKEEVQSQTCVFWVGAGISRDSGAPVAKKLSNGLVRYLSKKETVLEKEIYKVLPGPNDSAPIPDHFLTPWQYAPDEIKGSEADIFVKPAQEKTFLRLETVLEAIRQNIPCMLPLLFNKFDSLKPNSNHYILASALSKGHHIITTNWDSLIEKAGNISNDTFTVKIWNANTNKVDTKVINRPRGGIYLKLHGSLEKDSSPLSFINQFTTGATPEIQSLLRKILKERLIIFLGYSFSDFFDYQEILESLDKYSVRAFVIDFKKDLHEEKDWGVLGQKEYPLDRINCKSKEGIAANSKSFLKWLLGHSGEGDDVSVESDAFTREIIESLESGLSQGEKPNDWAMQRKGALLWLCNLLGKTRIASQIADSLIFRCQELPLKFDCELYWVQLINMAQAYINEGNNKTSLTLIKKAIWEGDFTSSRLDILMRAMELLDCGCEAALSLPSFQTCAIFMRKAEELFDLGINKCQMDNLDPLEVQIRLNQLKRSILAIFRNRPKYFPRVFNRTLEEFGMREKESEEEPFERSFFALNRKIYETRSKAKKKGNHIVVARCYKEYMEMCNVDGALGTLVDLAVYASKMNLDSCKEILTSGERVISSNTATIYARVKLYAALLGFNLIQCHFAGWLTLFCRLTRDLLKFQGQGKFLWAWRSGMFFLLVASGAFKFKLATFWKSSAYQPPHSLLK